MTYQETCNADALALGAPYQITDIRLEDATTAVAIVKALMFSFPVHAYYRDGRWLTTMTDSNRAGAEHWVATGGCLPDGS